LAAIGGRGTLIGAFVVNGAKSWFTQAFPDYWLNFLGALFVLTTLFLPEGVMGLIDKAKARSCDRAA
jgi:urea transport system permease protein